MPRDVTSLCGAAKRCVLSRVRVELRRWWSVVSVVDCSAAQVAIRGLRPGCGSVAGLGLGSHSERTQHVVACGALIRQRVLPPVEELSSPPTPAASLGGFCCGCAERRMCATPCEAFALDVLA